MNLVDLIVTVCAVLSCAAVYRAVGGRTPEVECGEMALRISAPQ